MKLSRLAVFALAALAVGGVAIFALTRGARERNEACTVHTFEASRFVVCTFDTRRHELRLMSEDRDGNYLRTFDALQSELGRDARRVRFAMNAGMFDDLGAPIGLYVENTQQKHRIILNDGPGNFHMKPNGVFWQGSDGALHVDVSDDYAATENTPRWATQSGPMLLIDGELHPQFQNDGPSRYVRNGVGVRDAHTAYFVISSGVVSFGRFARFFRDELEVQDALFFDGSVSSLWAPDMERQDDNAALGPLVVVLDR